MLFYKGDGVLASPIYPVADGFDLMPFPTGAPGRQRQRLNHGLFGVLQMGPLLIPIGGPSRTLRLVRLGTLIYRCRYLV